MFLFAAKSKAQYVNIPDSNFRSYLISYYSSCFNNAGQMDTTCSIIINEKNLGIYNSGITDLTGVQYFKSITTFDCSNYGSYYPPYNIPNVIVTLPKLSDSIRYLYCSANIISSITNLPASLRILDVSYNKLSILPSLPKKISVFDCSNNLFVSLPLLSDSLRELHCQKNNLTSLPLLTDSMKILICSNNQITTLPSLPYGIDSIDCSSNKLTTLPSLLLNDSLSGLNCSKNQLSSIPTLSTNLKTLNCSNNQLTNFPSLPNNLKTFNCDSNLLISLPAMSDSLRTLICSKNYLTSLPFLNDSLKILDCSNNLLDTLIGLPNNLYELNCSKNLLHNLPNLPTNLVNLFCRKNYLKQLPTLPNSTAWLDCSYNQLNSLPDLPNTFSALYCNHNKLINLPNLPKSLVVLDCSFNNLTSLPTLPPIYLQQLNCNDNSNLSCLPLLPKHFNPYYFSLANTNIKCVPNKPLFVSNKLANYPICDPTNNMNQCHDFPKINGIVFTDYNGNGKKDSIEYFKANSKIVLSNSAFTFTDKIGYFEIFADSVGSYTVSFANNNNLFSLIPPSYTHTFSSYDTLVIDTFALQPNVLKDSLTIKLTSWGARPGFLNAHILSYENVGTTVLSNAAVSLHYDSSLLGYDSSSVNAITNSGINLSVNVGNLLPGQTGSFVAYFTVKTTATLGSNVVSIANITTNTVAAKDTVQSIVRGSYDPNDKLATPSLTLQDVGDGKNIDYTIRFQNTGTDTAFNVVIADTLDSKLLANQLQMVGSSHPCRTTVKDNIIFFEFLDIMLPDSNVNKLGSNGFVSFKIKPISSVITGTIIPNKAAIYFDYNSPVITNPANTIIQNPLPLQLLSFSAIPQKEIDKVLVYWNTANEINTAYFIIETSSNATSFKAVAGIAAKGIGSNSYFYSIDKETVVYVRLKMVDKNGMFTYSNIFKIASMVELFDGLIVVKNPTKHQLKLNIVSSKLNNTNASLTNAQGRIVKRFILKKGNQAIDISGIAAGVYYLQSNEGSKKIIVE
jgi:uncharacterized repeat protein (TIGR01451 family)